MNLWQRLPQPVQAYIVSLGMTIQSVVVAMGTVGWSLGLCGTPQDTIKFFQQSWWAGVMAIVFGVGPYVRAHQANKQPIGDERG